MDRLTCATCSGVECDAAKPVDLKVDQPRREPRKTVFRVTRIRQGVDGCDRRAVHLDANSLSRVVAASDK
jgi:hypothetical protein